jgi:hypothetical protein
MILLISAPSSVRLMRSSRQHDHDIAIGISKSRAATSQCSTKLSIASSLLQTSRAAGDRHALGRNERVRLFSKNGRDWTRRYPWIAEAAAEEEPAEASSSMARPLCSVLTASPISTRCIPACTIMKSSSVHSTFSWKAATISGGFRSSLQRLLARRHFKKNARRANQRAQKGTVTQLACA